MILVLTSPSVIAPGNKVNSPTVDVLRALAKAGSPLAVISNHGKPTWFDAAFSGLIVPFIERIGRQDGTVISEIVKDLKMPTRDVVVLGATLDDLQMAKNGRAVLVSADWAADAIVKNYALTAKDPPEFSKVLHLVNSWPGGWYFDGKMPWYRVLSLSDVSGYNVSDQQKAFANDVVDTIKQGGPQLKALLVVTARSMLMAGLAEQSEMMFGFYPSSASANDDSEVLSEFVHHLRTVTSRVKLAKRGLPLFIRHKRSTKRSTARGNVDRTDPSEQVETVHLSPDYRGNIKGRHVIVVDDCTTYGVSFGVAAGLLKAAQATSVTGLALGKFGNRLRYYEIDIKSDPFKPITKGKYSLQSRLLGGTVSQAAQFNLRNLLSK